MTTSFLAVPSVKDLAADINRQCISIPEKYRRLDVQSELVSTNEDLDIPIIDMSRLTDPEFPSQELSKLHFACQEWGFFQLINHKVSSEMLESIKADITEFFELPLEKKNEYSTSSGILEGYGKAFVTSVEQKLDWADMLVLPTIPVTMRNMNLWPSQIRDSLNELSAEVYSLANVLVEFMANNLKVDSETIKSTFDDAIQTVRINYYPRCPEPEKVVGLTSHSDAAIITLVLQINEVPGLQIKRNGEWLTIKSLPGAFIVNVGDSLEVFSNGIYKSIEHRAIVNKEKERLSMALFHIANSNATIGPLKGVVNDTNEAKYKTMDSEEFMNLFYSMKLNGKSFLDGIKM